MNEEYATITCEDCGTALVLRYERRGAPSPDEPPVGCPECQATTSVAAAWRELEQAAAPRFLHLTALQKETEVGLASAMPHEAQGARAPLTPEAP